MIFMPTTTPVKGRDSYFDNAKFILIFLVVFGHLMQSYITEYASIRVLYIYVYTFHMPAFILISGFFAKNFRKPGYITKTMKKLILPYVFFQCIYSIFYYFLLGKSSFSIQLFAPEWSLWFLLSLFFWNIMLIGFAKLSARYAMPIAIVIGLVAGYFNQIDGYLSLSRTFVFFPFFLAGFYLTKQHFQYLQTKLAKWIGTGVIIAIVSFIIAHPALNENWFLGSKPYANFLDNRTLGVFIRLFVYAISFASISAFFSFVPKRQLFFTKWGKNTLYVYLLHGFFIKLFREGSVQTVDYKLQTIFLLMAISLGLTIILSSKVVTTIVQPVIELRFSKIRNMFTKCAGRFQKQSY